MLTARKVKSKDALILLSRRDARSSSIDSIIPTIPTTSVKISSAGLDDLNRFLDIGVSIV